MLSPKERGIEEENPAKEGDHFFWVPR